MSWAQTIIGIFDKILETVQIEEFLMQINKDFLYGSEMEIPSLFTFFRPHAFIS